MPRTLLPGLFAVVLVAAGAVPARADMPAGPWPWSKRAGPSVNRHLNTTQPTPEPAPPQPPTDPATGLPMWEHKPTPPKRTGPFRSCGSGMGVGLAGIGASWAVLWLGMRFVRAKKPA